MLFADEVASNESRPFQASISSLSTVSFQEPLQKCDEVAEQISGIGSKEGELVREFCGVRKGTKILTPNPLSKNGEGASTSPSPYLGKGPGDGEKACPTSVESLCPGDLVLTHKNRFMPVLKVMWDEREEEMLQIRVSGCTASLCISPYHPVAFPRQALPPFGTKVSTARHLRKYSTPAESVLWSFLRGKSLGIKFRRQHSLGPFILDFFAPSVRVAIELDGGIHEEEYQGAYDLFRQECVEMFGIQFIRLSNEEVLRNVGEALDRIRYIVKSREAFLDYGVLWVPAEDLRVDDSVFAEGTSEIRTVSGIKRLCVREPLCSLGVANDNSYVTDVCTVRNSRDGMELLLPKVESWTKKTTETPPITGNSGPK